MEPSEGGCGARLCSREWLGTALSTLRRAARAAPLGGEALLHFVVRSDNICLREERALLVDWNCVSVWNPLIDVVGWLPSLHAEGGPRPEEVLPSRAEDLAACFAGFLCSHAGRPAIATAPNVRATQLKQARTALPWAARALGLGVPS